MSRSRSDDSRRLSPSILDQVEPPPQAVEAEAAVLGSMLISVEAIRTASEILEPGDFYRDAHGTIFGAIVALWRRGEPADLVTVPEQLRGREHFELVGGVNYLTSLLDAFRQEHGHAGHVEHYARVVERASLQRQVMQGGYEVAALAREGREPADLLERWQAIGAAVSTRREQSLREPDVSVITWPEPLDESAYHGLAGQFVRVIAPHTEADPAALLFTFLVTFGVALGRVPHAVAEADRHRGNLFAVLVGSSGSGGKGRSWGYIEDVFSRADPVFAPGHFHSGLTSGEGLIHAVRDRARSSDSADGNDDDADEGVKDKRILFYEGEFGGVLRVLEREGNTLSAMIRLAWDGRTLSRATRNSPLRASGAHIGVLGHITPDEVRRYLSVTEMGNGFVNRFLWVCVRRQRILPFGGQIDEGALNEIVIRLKVALDRAREIERVAWHEDTRPLWATAYGDLSVNVPGPLGEATRRAAPQVLRIALLYAILDGRSAIAPDHLFAALECWRYCYESARYLFGEGTGNPLADRLLKALADAPTGFTTREIHRQLGGHVPAERLQQALTLLVECERLERVEMKTGGRNRTLYRVPRPGITSA